MLHDTAKMSLVYNNKLLNYSADKPTLTSLLDGEDYPINTSVESAISFENYVILTNSHGLFLYDEFIEKELASVNLCGEVFILNSSPFLYNGKFFEVSYSIGKKSIITAKEIKHICQLEDNGSFISFDFEVLYVAPNFPILQIQQVEETIVAENFSDVFASPDFKQVIYYQGVLFYIEEDEVRICFLNDLKCFTVKIALSAPYIYKNSIYDFGEQLFNIEQLLLKHIDSYDTENFELLAYPPKLPDIVEYHSFRQEFILANIEANNGLKIHPFPYNNIVLENKAFKVEKPIPYGVEETNFFFDPPLTVSINEALQLSNFQHIFKSRNAPAPRKIFNFVFFSPYDFFLFGGILLTGEVTNELYCGTVDFDNREVTYKEIETENAPKLHSHSLVLCNNEIYLLFGEGTHRNNAVFKLEKKQQKIRFREVLEFDPPEIVGGAFLYAVNNHIIAISECVCLFDVLTGVWSQPLEIKEAEPFMNYLVTLESGELICYSNEFKFDLSDIIVRLNETVGESKIDSAIEYLDALLANDYCGARDYCGANRALIYKYLCSKCEVQCKEELEEVIDVAPAKLVVDFVKICLSRGAIKKGADYILLDTEVELKEQLDSIKLALWLCEI